MNKVYDNPEEQQLPSEKEIFEYISDTAQLAQKFHTDLISETVNAAGQADKLTDIVEYWKWMQRNYLDSGIFDSPQTMLDYLAKGKGAADWMRKQLQGKGYEWDWIQAQRKSIKNLFYRFEAGDVANRPGTDVTKTNLFTGKQTEYQMKAYTSKTNPDLHNTPRDAVVVTNAEKVDVVRKNGFEQVESFQDAETISGNVDRRIDEIKKGKATPYYSFKNVGLTMAKAGAVGIVISASLEGISSWKAYKSGAITKKEYLIEVAKAAGEGGAIGAASAGIMIPISSALTVAGLASAPITIPVSIVVGGALSKIIAPMFGRGDYKKILGEAKFYQNLIQMNEELIIALDQAQSQFVDFMEKMEKQYQEYRQLDMIYDELSILHKLANQRIAQRNKDIKKSIADLNEYLNTI